MDTAFDEGKAEGFDEGKAAGKRENILEIAKNMKAAGYTNSDISKIIGVFSNEIKEL